MTTFLTRWFAVAGLLCAASSAAVAQTGARVPTQPVADRYAARDALDEIAKPGPWLVASSTQGELHGIIQDENGRPLSGAVISALGSKTTFGVSDGQGRFAFRNLPIGPYLVRAHLQGYLPGRGRLVQVTAGNRSTHTLSLTRNAEAAEKPAVLTAGLGGGEVERPADEGDHDHGEVAWRLRHATRSVLKEAEQAIVDFNNDDSLFDDSLGSLSTAVGGPMRLASALFADVTVSGQINLLTTTSFNRPQDLLLMDAAPPRGVAYLSLTMPRPNGEWSMRGTMTQGDLSSWIVAGAFRRSSDAPHAYEAGLSYSMQRYVGGNGEAVFAMRDGGRNVGGIYAYDNWAVAPRVRFGYGAAYSRYDYLPAESLISPRMSLSVQPWDDDSLVVRATVSHRETAPGAEEFTPPATGLWLPPVRTFSQISRDAFRPERLEHMEIVAEREFGEGVVIGLRTFRQRVNDQVVTLFGLGVTDARPNVGHYHVGSAGDFDARGWSVNASRAVGDGVRVSVDYTQFNSRWYGRSPDAAMLTRMAPAVMRKGERIHDMTASVESIIAPSATRMFILYKLNTGFASATDTTPSALRNVRFNVQVNQALPFLTFLSANWEMLVDVSNLFYDEPLGASVYDELFVVEPPKRVLGGVTMRF
jgi:hypothetical protein